MGYAEIHFDLDDCDSCNRTIPRSEGKTFTRPSSDGDGPDEILLFLCRRCVLGGSA